MSWVVVATASVGGVPIGSARYARGESVRVGEDPELPVPQPVGASASAQLSWVGADQLVGKGWRGEEVRLAPGQDLELALGGVVVGLSLAPAFPVLRWGAPAWASSLAWFATVLGLGLVTAQADVTWRHHCAVAPAVFGERALTWYPDCAPAQSDAGHPFAAEVLQRLLLHDLDGEEAGKIFDEFDRPEADTPTVRLYMPAGAEGPKDHLGGAAELDVEAHHQDATRPRPADLPKPALPQAKSPDQKGIAVRDPTELDDDGKDDVVQDGPADVRQGYGLKDWYNEEDARIDALEVKMMLREAKARLRIDPDDPSALSLLSYYQYLAQDYDAALVTYDHYIELDPSEAAGYNNKALVYKRRADYETEERLYRLALALSPDDVTALNNLAICLGHQGRFDEALDIMARLEALDPGDAYADLHRAKLLAMMGKDDEALLMLDRSLEGMAALDTLHLIEYRQDIRVDPAFARLREQTAFHRLLAKYYGKNTPLPPLPGSG